MAPWAVSLLSGTRAGGPCYVNATENQYVEHADRAFEQLENAPANTQRGFGEMVARRGVARWFEYSEKLEVAI